MKKTMIDLWRGEGIAHCASEHCRKEVMQLVKALCRHEKELKKQLDDRGWEILEALQDTHGAIASLEMEDAFVRGFTLGIQLMTEAFSA
ncbi:MAG: hypothetical protein E7585_03925 [Ruminococcaceae bacterium]|nr:hypothetical protein [Oscillospiraceae bacterium]